MPKIVRLIVASGETSSDLRYAAGFSAPDECIWFDDGAGRRGVVMSALEFGRASRSARPDTEVLPEQQFGVTRLEILSKLAVELRADGYLVPEDFPAGEMPVYIAPTFTKPIFLINGSNDRRTPVWMSEKVLALLPPSTPRRLMVVEGAGHGGKEDPMILEFERFVSQVADFLKEQLGVEDNARGR